MISGICKFLDMNILVPVLTGALVSHRFLKSEDNISFKKIILTGYAIYGAIFVLFDYAARLSNVFILKRATIWKYFCCAATIILLILEIKYLFSLIRKKRKHTKSDYVLAISIAVLFIFFAAALYHRPYQALADLIMSGKLSDPDPLYEYYFIAAFITGLGSARILYYAYAFIFTVIYFCFYKAVGEYFYREKETLDEVNQSANSFVGLVVVFLIFPVLLPKIDLFGVFTCPWKSETLLASLFAPAVFMAGIMLSDVFSKKNDLRKKAELILLLLITSLDALLSTQAALIYFLLVLVFALVTAFIKKIFINNEKRLSEGESA